MKQKALQIIFSVLFISVSHLGWAQVEPNRAYSPSYLKTGSRNATIAPSSAFFNPAGAVWWKDGHTIELSVLTLFNRQEVTDFRLNQSYSSEIVGIPVPAINYIYKKNNWAIVGTLGITNGGGTGDFEDGFIGLDFLGRSIVQQGIASGMFPSDNPSDYSIRNSFNGAFIGLGGTAGVAYKFNDWLSASASLQVSFQNNFTEGELVITHTPSGEELSRTEVDFNERGNNLGFIFGLNIKPNEKLLIANTFRIFTELELEAEVNDGKDGNGLFVQDGQTQLATYVPTYQFGLSYLFHPKWRAEVNMTVFWYDLLDLGSDENGINRADYYNNDFDFGIGVEYQVTEKLNLGAGFSYQTTGLKDEFQSENLFETSTANVHLGATYQFNERWGGNFGMQAGFSTDEVDIPASEFGSRQQITRDPLYFIGIGAFHTF
ncbi:MAG: OmpP1/FadL family transporter [Thermonemataceae bacterium]